MKHDLNVETGSPVLRLANATDETATKKQPTNKRQPKDMTTKMKTLIIITAHAYEGTAITHPERAYHYIRPRNAKKPTYAGAARMVAAEIGGQPSDVSVTRIESVCYAAR